jgi:hypothetical protein
MKRILILCAVLIWAGAAVAEPELSWNSLYDGGAGFDDAGLLVTATVDGDVIVAGTSHDGVLGADIVVLRLAAEDGDEAWLVRIPSFDDSDMTVTGLALDGAGDVLVVGYIQGCVG